jgi:hypothetical protein
MRRALVTGISGQDGSYLAELLLRKGYQVHGIIRRASSFNTGRLDHIYQDPHEPTPRLQLHYGDLTDAVALVNLIRAVAPDEVYHLGAQSHVKVSFEVPEYTGESTGLGAIRLLEAIRASGVETRFYQASSSEMFGSVPPPQDELTPFHPRSPYGCAKVYAFWTTVNYREAYGLFAVQGSERRRPWSRVREREPERGRVGVGDPVVPRGLEPSVTAGELLGAGAQGVKGGVAQLAAVDHGPGIERRRAGERPDDHAGRQRPFRQGQDRQAFGVQVPHGLLQP